MQPASSLINKYCTAVGLTTSAGKLLNGEECFVVRSDLKNADRLAVVFLRDLGDPDAHYVSLKPDNLQQKDYPVEIRRSSVDGGGNGLFATKDIKMGDVIFKERAFIELPLHLAAVAPMISTPASYLAGVEKNSCLPAREALAGLTPVPSISPTHAGLSLGGHWGLVFGNNMLSSPPQEKGGMPRAALYPLICRINHRCGSANVSWDGESDRTLRATADIAADEELFADYVLSSTRSARRRRLANYGIPRCADCVLCDVRTTPDGAVAMDTEPLWDRMEATLATITELAHLNDLSTSTIAKIEGLMEKHAACARSLSKLVKNDKQRIHMAGFDGKMDVFFHLCSVVDTKPAPFAKHLSVIGNRLFEHREEGVLMSVGGDTSHPEYQDAARGRAYMSEGLADRIKHIVVTQRK